MIGLPSRKIAPSHKTGPFLLHLQKFFLEYWEGGCNIVGNEQDAGFQGKHSNKVWVTFKRKRDGFLIDAICDDRFIITFYFQHISPR